jgi:hypothetical protein
VGSEAYRDYVIVSRPTKKYGDASGWFPQVTIFWKIDGRQHWHTIEPNIVFSNEKDAEAEGLSLARAWVDRRL